VGIEGDFILKVAIKGVSTDVKLFLELKILGQGVRNAFGIIPCFER
jgi:hypothetical protein